MSWFKKILGHTGANHSQSANSLQADFRKRYAIFLNVLQANNQGLEIFNELEAALRGERLFGMAFVRSRANTALDSAEKMASGLIALAPKKYEILAERVAKLRETIHPLLKIHCAETAGPLVIDLYDIHRESADMVGGKMANLAELASVFKIAVPNGFVVTSVGYRRFFENKGLRERILARIEQLKSPDSMDELRQLSSDLQNMILQAEIPNDLSNAITQAYTRLRDKSKIPLYLALRSSAVGEDFADISFAGQYQSKLGVTEDKLLQTYREIIASKYTLTAISYRLARGITDEQTPMCVGCLKMIKASRSGVMYTRNPLSSSSNKLLISAVFGLPKGVVDGSTQSDLYIIKREGPVTLEYKEIADKKKQYRTLADGGISLVPATSEQISAPVLTESQAVTLAELGLTLEAFYGLPMDIEWAFDENDKLVLLQCRPLSLTHKENEDSALLDDPEHTFNSEKALISGGLTASRGVASGSVHLVLKEADMLSFPHGGILVAQQSSPRLAPLLARAAGIICEQGSVTGHLANVAREFGVPALFGITSAFTLQQGKKVTLDADMRAVFEGQREELLTRQSKARNLMEGSPVLSTLQKVSKTIVPLTLLDPDSPGFRASNCMTLHDVTRFCHERAVHEMFRFGKHHEHPKRSSKRLVANTPMQWWVLDLDDGLQGDDKGKYVHLNDIISIPMLALWDGITALPWAGPPAVDGKGMVSIFFHSTMNRSLDPASPSLYSQRNYFMISKNYCSLHSRFGYHFAQVEGLVGDIPRENFASFRFQGGAADDLRRQRRVLMLGELLEERGFRVVLKDDRLSARLERLEKKNMEAGLRVLGHLLMHTRQLDMVMNNSEQAAHWRSRLRQDMETVATLK